MIVVLAWIALNVAVVALRVRACGRREHRPRALELADKARTYD